MNKNEMRFIRRAHINHYMKNAFSGLSLSSIKMFVRILERNTYNKELKAYA
jgi:hypothetical protein